MKTKYIKVAVSERLPEKAGFYFVINSLKGRQMAYFGGFTFAESFFGPEYWLEEVPDREQEMKDLLREIYPLLMERDLYIPGQKIQKILNEIYLTH